mgnify:CR=1 FL=1
MQDTKIIFAKRLKSAREMKGLSMAELSDAMGNIVSPQAIYKYESGKMLPNANILKVLGDALKLPIDHFFKEYKVSLCNIEFRKKASLLVKDRKTIETTSLDRVEKYFEILDICGEDLIGFRKEAKLITSKEDVIETVQNIRKRHGLGSDPIQNVLQFLEGLGIIVIVITNENNKFDGLSGLANNTPVIVLNSTLPAERMRFTALHELGHLILNFDESINSKGCEKLCNTFASEMLIPSKRLEEYINARLGRKLALPELAIIQKAYGVSIDALIYKATEIGLVNERTLQTYHILKNQNPKFRDYAETPRAGKEESDKFENMVMRAYDCDLITIEQAALFLGTTAAEIEFKSLII